MGTWYFQNCNTHRSSHRQSNWVQTKSEFYQCFSVAVFLRGRVFNCCLLAETVCSSLILPTAITYPQKKISPFHWWSIAGQFTIWCCFWLRWDNCGSCHVSASLQPAAPSCLWKGQCWDELEPELQARVKHKASKTMDSWQQDVFSGLSLGPRVMVKHSIYSWRGFWWVTEKLSKQVIMGKSTFRTVLWLKRNWILLD